VELSCARSVDSPESRCGTTPAARIQRFCGTPTLCHNCVTGGLKPSNRQSQARTHSVDRTLMGHIHTTARVTNYRSSLLKSVR